MYDAILFGVTGFTGKLAAEYIISLTNHHLRAASGHDTAQVIKSWAVSARNETKAREVLNEIAQTIKIKNSMNAVSLPEILVVDLVCQSEEEIDRLRSVVRQTKLVLTTAGPYKVYGKTLVNLCAELGVHYCDITGETNFVRDTILSCDTTAQASGAVIIHHCGNDCIPNDLLTYEIHRYAQKMLGNNAVLKSVMILNEVSDTAAFSGGTAATALLNLRKESPVSTKPAFDPLLTNKNGTKSEYETKNSTPKSFIRTDAGKASPWIMGPVMVNCIRRSNALLHYSHNLQCADLLVESKSWSGWFRSQSQRVGLATALIFPYLRGLLPAPGQGPSRDEMEHGFLTLHARAIVECPGNIDSSRGSKATKTTTTTQEIHGTFHFGKDTAYLYTAAFLVETGMLLLEKQSTDASTLSEGGVGTPASALGHDLTNRLLDRLDAKLDLRLGNADRNE